MRHMSDADYSVYEIPGWYEYGVTCDGFVFSLTGWRGHDRRQLTANPDRQGYLRVRLGRDRKKVRVHQLVMRVFGDTRPSPGHEIRHLDGNPGNNHIRNLRWGTQQDNADDRERHGRTSRGQSHSESIRRAIPNAFTPEETETAISLRRLGWSQRRIATELGRSQSGVGLILRRRV